MTRASRRCGAACERMRALLDLWFRGVDDAAPPSITSAFLFTEALHDPLHLECIELARRAEFFFRFVGLAMIAE